MRHAGVAKNLTDGQAKLARAADDDVVSKSRCLRGDLFFSTGWLNDAAGAAQEPRQVHRDGGSAAVPRPC